VWWPVASASLSAVVVQDDVAEWRQQAVEQRDWGVRIDGGALPEGFLPPGLERGGQFFAHPLRGVGAYRPRIPGTWCPSRCSARISGMPSSAIHVLWPCRRPWGVSPALTGSQEASGGSLAGGSPLPGQWVASFLWVTALPSSRSLTACPQDGQRPVPWVLTSRWIPRPDGGANGFPGTVGGHDAAGVPGHAAASTITSVPGLPFAGGCLPSQAGRKIRRA
jgi:hypothetical protein